MNDPPQNSRHSTRRLVVGLRLIPSAGSVAGDLSVVALVHAILHFTVQEFRIIGYFSIPASIGSFAVFAYFRESTVKRLSRYFRARDQGCETPEQTREAFGLIVNHPPP